MIKIDIGRRCNKINTPNSKSIPLFLADVRTRVVMHMCVFITWFRNLTEAKCEIFSLLVLSKREMSKRIPGFKLLT